MPSTEERRMVTDRFMRAAAALAERTRIPEAQEIWSFLQEFACYADPAPSPNGQINCTRRDWVFPGTRETQTLMIVPLFSEDVGRFSDVWDKLFAARANALYLPFANLIMLRAQSEETDPVLGTTLLHEGGHAQRAAREGRAGIPCSSGLTDAMLAEECCMYALEGRFWAELGGDVYRRVLNRGVYWVEKKLSRQKRSVGSLFIGLARYDQKLDDILGTAPTEDSRASRKLHFDILANFAAINRSALPNKPGAQAELLRGFYGFHGLSVHL